MEQKKILLGKKKIGKKRILENKPTGKKNNRKKKTY